MDKRNISIKNYIIYILIVIFSFICVFSLATIYSNYKEEKDNVSIMPNTVVEIYGNNVKSYILENDDVVIYLAASDDQSIKDFELAFKEYIIKKQINERIVYLDLTTVTKEYVNNFINTYYGKVIDDAFVTPNMVIINGHKIIDMLYFSKSDINISDVNDFLIEHEVTQ